MKFKKLILGEEIPDKDDPKYRDRYEKEVDAGRKFAKWIRFDKGIANIQRFAENHRKVFLIIVFSIVAFCFMLNIYRMAMVCNRPTTNVTATERQEQLLKQRRQKNLENLKHTTTVIQLKTERNGCQGHKTD